MRQIAMILAVLMMLLFLLCACGRSESNPLQAPMDFRGTLLAQGGCHFVAEACAETGDRVWALTLDCTLNAEGSGTVTVLAPETIAGITARIDGEDGSLCYETLVLGLGTLPDSTLAPVAAPGKLVLAWARDWIASAGAEDETLLVCYSAEALEVRTRFGADGTPVQAELLQNGKACFSAELHNFEWKAETKDETTEENVG
ncbi:MAG: hypothetical protein IKS21_02715 [Oscillospiraceae bacterium]|nr:hypothetical protein [Oscillospiraceae bacterium]